MDFVSSSPFSLLPPFFQNLHFVDICRQGKKCKKTRRFPNRGERYGAKYENGVAYLLSYTVSVEKLWTQNTRIIRGLLVLSNEEKTNDYENFEKGMINMKILKKGGG